MINSVTFRVVARKHTGEGVVHLNAQCFVNHQRVVIPLKIAIAERYFDNHRELVKPSHPDALHHNSKIATARSNAASIAAIADATGVFLNRKHFRSRFISGIGSGDFIEFWRLAMNARATNSATQKAEITATTLRQHISSLKKLQQFSATIPFTDLQPELVRRYKKWLLARGNKLSTVATAMKNLKCYCHKAIEHGLIAQDPFAGVKIDRIKGRKEFLTPQQVKSLLALYDSRILSDSMQQSLLVFLISCFVSLRISDIRRLSPEWIIRPRTILFRPLKTIRFEKPVEFTFSKTAERLVNDFFAMKQKVKSDQKINDDLKLLAARQGLIHNLSMHVGRHTFATTYLFLKGDPYVLQDIMGHGRIDTTMEYVHVISEVKAEQMGYFDDFFG